MSMKYDHTYHDVRKEFYFEIAGFASATQPCPISLDELKAKMRWLDTSRSQWIQTQMQYLSCICYMHQDHKEEQMTFNMPILQACIRKWPWCGRTLGGNILKAIDEFIY
eukprot:979833_1